ncbi:expressed unknown protein [Seminavis robusta]|uniref:Uncharacterized protein n=1 Tax=Seminavis robusta TaxID=568900 RepID=A0A9N8H8I8_9STRA|nr:expressed unknown protein [Seminavis robusta]|eukprot:Sro161_g072550.1 n/a (827) ;mRNA; f:63867-66347
MTTVAERWGRRLLFHEWTTLWKVAFALVAVADFLGCWPLFLEGWVSAVNQNKPGVSSSQSWDTMLIQQYRDQEEDTCSTYSIGFYTILGKCLYTLDWMGPLFCLMCIGEAMRRAQQAREDLLELAALDNFEKKLARLYSSARNVHAQEEEDTMYDEDDILARKTLRFWTPVVVTLSLWSLLMPWHSMLDTRCGPEADTALATHWINESLRQMAKTAEWAMEWAMDEIMEWVWHLVLPFSFWQPHKIYQRIRTLLRWVRYFRFAGPLLRLLLKLNDQFWAVLRTSKQAWQANAEKAKRLIHRSMLFEDLQKIEAKTKTMPRLSRVPTKTIVSMASEESAEVGNKIKEKRQQEKKMRRELDNLKVQIGRSSRVFPTSEIYDRIVDLSQEFTSTVGSTLWTANLISPRTRFSVSWRVIVTCALVSELCRMCTSFQLYGRVDESYTTMMISVLGCAQDRGNILTATGRLTRKIVRKLIRLPKEQLLSTCTKSSIASHSLANILLYMSGAFETTIDLICFVDIYVWFFTGELDPEGSGHVIPKPFFYRCIIPGTLVQVLDHPTVPELLPNIMYYSAVAASAVGYSRLIRWVVAVVPTINSFLVDPIKKFLFRPMEEDEWLRYTESLAIFPAISGEDIRYTMSMSHPNLSHLDEPECRGLSRARRSSMLAMPSASEYTGGVRRKSSALKFETSSFLPPVTELSRRESSSAGLNLDSQHLPSALKTSSFLPSELRRRESSSAGLNLDSEHVSSALKLETSGFLPPEVRRRVSSSAGLNLENQHVPMSDAAMKSINELSRFDAGELPAHPRGSRRTIEEEDEPPPLESYNYIEE